jgi:hypothetical protein
MLTLRYGDKAPEVRYVRGFLREFGLCDARDSDEFDLQLRDAVVEFQQTHSGPDGLPLEVDGVVGSKTWWSLKRDPHVEEHTTHGITIPSGLTPMRRAVLKEAVRWLELDVRETPLGSNRGPVIDTCLPKWRTTGAMAAKKGPPWCAFCADQIAYNATGCYPHVSQKHPKGRKMGGCYQSYLASKELDQWTTAPTPGDQAIILYRDPTGKLTQKGHKFTVVRVDDTHVNGLEGNYGNAFRASKRSREMITGYVNWFPLHEQRDNWERGTVDVRAPKNETTR